VADQDERLAHRVDDGGQVGSKPVERERPRCLAPIPEASQVQPHDLELKCCQFGDDRVPDVLVIEKAVHENDRSVAGSIPTELDVAVWNGS
jgi:hypothetical protein